MTIADLMISAGKAARSALRLDGWTNVLTGLGSSLRDKTLAASFRPAGRLSDAELEAMYHDEDLAGAICDRLPEEMLRCGFDVTLGDGEVAGDLMQRWRELDGDRAVVDAMVWGRVFGGGAVYVVANDGASSEAEPLGDYDRIDALHVLDRRELQPIAWYDQPRHPKLGKPERYMLQRSLPGAVALTSTNVEIHESRLVVFGGSRTSRRRRVQNNGWDEPILQRCYGVLRAFGMSWDGAAYLMSDMSQAVFKIRDLLQIMASADSDAEAALTKRLELVEMSRSVARAVVLDAEGEDFERKATPIAGVPDLLELFMFRLSAAARMPVTLLFGRSPAGMNATGESDLTQWYDFVAAKQSTDLAPQLRALIELLFREGGQPVPEAWDLKFRPLWSPSAKEQAEIRKLTAETDAVYIDKEVATPAEIATSRFTPHGYSTETTIDLDARKIIREAEIQRAIENAEDPPELPVAPTPATGTEPTGSSDPTDDNAAG